MWKLQHQSAPTDSQIKKNVTDILQSLTSQKQIGFADMELLHQGLQSCMQLAQSMNGHYDTFCVLGIGGSSLGSQAVIEALAPELLEQKRVIYFDNVDAKSFFRKVKMIPNLQRTLWILISKSGGTVETLAQADYLHQYLSENHQIMLHQKSVVITENKSNPLFDWAQKYKVPRLDVPVNVGGRFSVLTPVGLFIFCLLKMDVEGLLKGAQKALSDKQLVAELATQFSMSFLRNETTTYFFSYCDDLKFWGLWLQQLWAESLGKKVDLQGRSAPLMSLPYACRGAMDQHSVLQQIAEGTQKKMVCFLRVNESENFGPSLKEHFLIRDVDLRTKNMGQLLSAEATAIQQSLNESNIQTVTLQTSQLNPEAVGFLLMTFQLVVATLGQFHNIDPFNQPGVERGKVLTRQILKQEL